jgi:hypothetical protein
MSFSLLLRWNSAAEPSEKKGSKPPSRRLSTLAIEKLMGKQMDLEL